jgi:RNA polymerase sigma factor (sigma-70 family)
MNPVKQVLFFPNEVTLVVKTKEAYFLACIEKHKGILHKLSKIYMDHLEDQEDLFQEMIYQLWKSFDQYRGDSQFSTWMYRVALNTALVFFKKEKKKREQPLSTEADHWTEETAPVDHETQLSYFYKAVHELNAIEKALIFLFLEGQTTTQIAQNLGLTEVNTRVKLSRSKEKLQQIIKRNGYEF